MSERFLLINLTSSSLVYRCILKNYNVMKKFLNSVIFFLSKSLIISGFFYTQREILQAFFVLILMIMLAAHKKQKSNVTNIRILHKTNKKM